MAQLFPMRPAGSRGDDAGSPLVEILLALPDPWVLLRDRRIGAGDRGLPVEVVLVHPEIGVALIDEAPRDPTAALGAFRAYLDDQRFAEFYPGELPAVALSVPREELDEIGDRLAAAFEVAPRLTVADGDWADAIVELLLTADDLPMARVAAPTALEETAPRPAAAEPLVEARRETSRVFDGPDLDARLEPLMGEWPFVPRVEPPRWRGGHVAAAVALLLLAGLGFAAWHWGGAEPAAPEAAILVPKKAEALVPPQPASPRLTAAEVAPSPVAPAPPPVPPAAPVLLTAKPFARLPPAAPKPTPVKPLPQIAARETAPKPPAPLPAPSREAPPPATAAALSSAPPPAAAPAKSVRPSAPQRGVAAAPHPAKEARLTPARPRPTENSAEPGPPIDATELPPIQPDQSVSPPIRPQTAPPVATVVRPPVVVAAPAYIAPAPGPAAPVTGECRPYIAESPLAGRGLAVQGIACRDANGAWRLVSEVPLR